MTDRRQPKKAVWKKKPPTKEGWYWYRDEKRAVVLHVFDPLGNGYWKAWDWKEKAKGDDYETKIKSLKERFPVVNPEYFDTLYHIQDMTSDKVHEQSWDKWESPNLKLILETLKAVLHEIYVIPDERKQKSVDLVKLRDKVRSKEKQVQPGTITASEHAAVSGLRDLADQVSSSNEKEDPGRPT